MKILVFFAVLLWSVSAWAKVLVVDGDSLEMDGRRIRLNGLDAPEYNQPCWDANGVEYDCGNAATQYMKQLTKGQKVRCDYLKQDTYKRYLSVCYAGDLNLNREMVLNGYAVSYDFGAEGYPEEEKLAKQQKKGIWQGKFMRPELWRRLVKE